MKRNIYAWFTCTLSIAFVALVFWEDLKFYLKYNQDGFELTLNSNDVNCDADCVGFQVVKGEDSLRNGEIVFLQNLDINHPIQRKLIVALRDSSFEEDSISIHAFGYFSRFERRDDFCGCFGAYDLFITEVDSIW
jgi:hypothetical protein